MSDARNPGWYWVECFNRTEQRPAHWNGKAWRVAQGEWSTTVPEPDEIVGPVPTLGALAAQQARIAQLEAAIAKGAAETGQTLGKALGYPRYKDDPTNFPGATEADGVCVGEHVPETLAMEAAVRFAELEAALRALFRTYLARGEVVERVAKALAKDEWPHVGGADGQCLTPGTPNWRHRTYRARAALASILPEEKQS